MGKEIDETASENLFVEGLSGILKDYSRLGARLRCLEHNLSSNEDSIKLRLHYPSIRDGEATVSEFADSIVRYLIRFCLHKSAIDEVERKYAGTDDYLEEATNLFIRAKNLFKLAHRATNRNGEAGELILFLLTEWILNAPQILAKMSLKTNPEMPVFGSDGIHAKYCNTRKGLIFYFGESKLYSDVGQAISKAATSIADALSHKKLTHEFELIKSNIDLSGLDPQAKSALIKYLDPYEEESNHRYNIATCLIGFDLDAYSQLTKDKESEILFQKSAIEKIEELKPAIKKAFNSAGLQNIEVELFLLPLPSVKDFRNYFQENIGWKPDHAGNF